MSRAACKKVIDELLGMTITQAVHMDEAASEAKLKGYQPMMGSPAVKAWKKEATKILRDHEILSKGTSADPQALCRLGLGLVAKWMAAEKEAPPSAATADLGWAVDRLTRLDSELNAYLQGCIAATWGWLLAEG